MMKTSTEEKVVDLKKLSREEMIELALERIGKQRHPWIIEGMLKFLLIGIECHKEILLDVCRILLDSPKNNSKTTAQSVINFLPRSLEVEDNELEQSGWFRMHNGVILKKNSKS